jgi:integrase/recombinase XerD
VTPPRRRTPARTTGSGGRPAGWRPRAFNPSHDAAGFVTAQHTGGTVDRLQLAGDDSGGVSARTVRRRLSSVSGLFGFAARGDVEANPVPRGLPTRRERQRPRQGVALVRSPRTLPRVLEPIQVDALLAALRTWRDRAMVEAMLLGAAPL